MPRILPALAPGLAFLVAIAPVVSLWSQNAEAVTARSLAVPFMLTVLPTAGALLVLRLLTADYIRSTLSLSLVWLPLLTFGYQVDGFEALLSAAPDSLRWPLLAANVAAAGVFIATVWRAPFSLRPVAEYGTLLALIFIVLSVPGIIRGGVSIDATADRPSVAWDVAVTSRELPDVYYIVLDGYARGDVLAELYGYDNSRFLRGLEDRGFFVADESFSNYAVTPLSIASGLGMRYVDDAAEALVEGHHDPFVQLIHEPEIALRLRELGYRYVHLNSLWHATASAPLADVTYGLGGLSSEFELVFFRTTLPGRFASAPGWHESHLHTLEKLREIPGFEAPTFTFAHMLIPHPPYVFDSEGNVLSHEGSFVGGWEQPHRYVEQLEFLNAKLEELVGTLLTESETPPIIIIQADHGPAMTIEDRLGRGLELNETAYWERMAILNAYLVPPDVRPALYPSITPVNSFRLLLREHYGQDIDLLADRSYFSRWGNPPEVPREAVELRDVTDTIRTRSADAP
ncbi:MAG: hypothetical protein ACRDGV_10515 [Candidatus Limnocylindria bacterium]